MAAEALTSVVMQKLADMSEESSATFDKVMLDQLKDIKQVLGQNRGFIDAENKQESDQAVKKWVGEYLRNLYDVEDVIENFALRVARQGKRLGFLRTLKHCLFLNKLRACRKARRQMKQIGRKIKILKLARPDGIEDASRKSIMSQTSVGDEETPRHTHSREQNGTIAEEPQEETKSETDDIVRLPLKTKVNALQIHAGSTISEIHTVKSNKGTAFRYLSETPRFSERLRQARQTFSNSYDEQELGNAPFKQDVRTLVKRLEEIGNLVVPIVGDAGSGKTTLAREIYRNRDIKEYFKCRAWVFISEEYSKSDLLLSLLKQVEDSKDKVHLIPEIGQESRLSERLRNNRYLVVMDDVRSNDAWEKIKRAFPDTKNGSKIIFITCNAEVAKYADPESLPHHMERLTEKDSWDMFLNKVGFEETSQSNADNSPKHKILKICKGLPLNIVLLSGLLSTKKVDEWSSILLSSSHNVSNWETSDILTLSYNDLGVHSMLCLLYLALFPKEFDIPVRRLLRLWLAEGFAEQLNGTVPEDVVQKYFKDLVFRNMIYISKLSSDGSPRRCRLLGFIHDFLLSKATDIGLFHIHRNSANQNAAGRFGIRRMIEYLDIKNWPLDTSKIQLLRSFLSFNHQKKDTPAKYVGSFVSKIIDSGFGLLRVLDLEGVYKPSLPDKLGDLIHLRYLGLRWTFLDTLPSSVGNLPYLETLDVKRTRINSLPSSVWKLKHLRNLNLNEIRLDMPTQQLTRLLTLWGLFVDHKNPVKNGLDSLQHLRELGITFNLSSSEDLVDWIANLTALESLRLRSRDDAGKPSKLCLKPLPGLAELSNLYLLGNLQTLLVKPDHFPPNLKVLTLSVSELKEDPMPTLGQLPSLTVLRLLAKSYLGQKLVCHQGGFRRLRVLKLWMLTELEEWDVEKEAMQRLKELNIRECHRLKKIPPGLLELKTFELTLTNMPKEFTNDIKQKKTEDIFLTVNYYESTPMP